MKKDYNKPTMTVVQLHHRTTLLVGSTLSKINSNAGLNYSGAGTGTARSRGDDVVDEDEWDE